MSDTKIQDAFQALQQNMPVVLLYSSARGRHQWGLVQAFSADALPANHLDIKACLLGTEVTHAFFLQLGLQFAGETLQSPDIAWLDALNPLNKISLYGSQSSEAVIDVPFKSTPNGGTHSQLTWCTCAQDLVCWAGLGPLAWMLVPESLEKKSQDHDHAIKSMAQQYAAEHDLPFLTTQDLLDWAHQSQPKLQPSASNAIPLASDGEVAEVKVYSGHGDPAEHVAIAYGDWSALDVCPVRLHSECLTGDVLGSQRCDCGWQLQESQRYLRENGGVLLYLRQEGRGIGLAEKIKSYGLQDQGIDTVEANYQLGFGDDERSYRIAIHMLQDLGLKRIKLLTNNPDKVAQLSAAGIDIVERVRLQMTCNKRHSAYYLQTKKAKLGHWLDFTSEDSPYENN